MAPVTVHHEGPIVTRQEAMALGLRRYFPGTVCKRGHIAERDLNSTCVECKHPTRTPSEITGIFYEGRLITRKEARTQGLKRYFTGKACKKGHLAERYVSGGCVICQYENDRRRIEARRHPRPITVVIYQGPIVSRASAKSAKEVRYFNGKPCKHGHVDQHFTSNGTCVACTNSPHAKDVRLAYSRRDSVIARAAVRRQSPASIELFERRRFSERGLALYRSYVLRRRAHRRNAGGKFTADDLLKLLSHQKHCHICGKRFTKSNPPTVDHIIPLSKGGCHDISNISLAHGSCNSRKHAKITHLI